MPNYLIESEKIQQCMEWLLEFLDRPKPRRVVRGEAVKKGFSQQQLKQARKNLKVKLTQEVSEDKNEFEDHWFLSLW